MILQSIRIIVGDAGLEPGTSAPEVWYAIPKSHRISCTVLYNGKLCAQVPVSMYSTVIDNGTIWAQEPVSWTVLYNGKGWTQDPVSLYSTWQRKKMGTRSSLNIQYLLRKRVGTRSSLNVQYLTTEKDGHKIHSQYIVLTTEKGWHQFQAQFTLHGGQKFRA